MQILKIDDAEHATILAALRYYQANGQGEPANRTDAIHDIATNGDAVISLDANAIDGLCERINGGEAVATRPDKLYLLATDTDYGLEVHTFSTEADREEWLCAYMNTVLEWRDKTVEADFGGDRKAAWDYITDKGLVLDGFVTEDVDVPANEMLPQLLHEAIAVMSQARAELEQWAQLGRKDGHEDEATETAIADIEELDARIRQELATVNGKG